MTDPPMAPARRTRLPDRLWVPALIAAALAVGFASALLVRADGDASLLVHAAPPWSSDAGSRGSLTVQPDTDDGFDGQFFYRLGVAPWSTEETVDGVTFDLPSLRNARWGYGALAFAASGGDADLVPWALLGLNVVAATAVGAIGGGLARGSGRHAAWGALFALWPGFAYSLSLDTSELVASAFVLGGLLALRRRRWPVAAALLTAAVLTRDTTTVVPVGVAAAGAVAWWSARRRAGADAGAAMAGTDVAVPLEGGTGATARPERGHGARSVDDARVPAPTAPATSSAGSSRGGGGGGGTLLTGVVPLVAFVGWQALQRERFGSLPVTSSGDNNLSAPLAGLVDQLGELLPPGGGEDAFRLLSIAGLVTLVAGAAWCWRTTRAPWTERLAWLPAVAVVVVLNAYLWSGATAFMRAATEAGLLSIALVLAGPRHRRLLPLAAAGLGGLWLLTAVAQLTKLP